MAREGLRVLVVSKKSLTEEQYQDFEVSIQNKLMLSWGLGLILMLHYKKVVVWPVFSLQLKTTKETNIVIDIFHAPVTSNICWLTNSANADWYFGKTSVSKCQSVLFGNQTDLWPPSSPSTPPSHTHTRLNSLFEQGRADSPAVVSPRHITEVYNWVSRAGGQQWVTNWVTYRVCVPVWVTRRLFLLYLTHNLHWSWSTEDGRLPIDYVFSVRSAL